MNSKAKSLLASVFLLTTLTACDDSGNNFTLAPVPAELKTCFSNGVPVPKPGAMTRAQVADLIAQLKQSELQKSQCGRRLIAWYEAQAKVYGAVQ